MGWTELAWVKDLSFIIEHLYYIASIGLFASVVIGLLQLKVLKEDIKTKNQRAAMEKSLEYLNWFASDFFPYMAKYKERLDEVKETIISKADPKEQEVLRRKLYSYPSVEYDVKDKFQKNERECGEHILIVRCQRMARVGNVLNQLEYFAAAMTCGLANEELAYNPLSEAYCDVVEETYYALCIFRNANPKLYSNVVKLYHTWKPRIHKEELEGKHRELSDKLSQIPDTKIKTIGL